MYMQKAGFPLTQFPISGSKGLFTVNKNYTYIQIAKKNIVTKMTLNLLSKTVFVKTVGLSDKTGKFLKCTVNFVSLPDSMSDEKL